MMISHDCNCVDLLILRALCMCMGLGFSVLAFWQDGSFDGFGIVMLYS